MANPTAVLLCDMFGIESKDVVRLEIICTVDVTSIKFDKLVRKGNGQLNVVDDDLVTVTREQQLGNDG